MDGLSPKSPLSSSNLDKASGVENEARVGDTDPYRGQNCT
jgi:hypothetical protein